MEATSRDQPYRRPSEVDKAAGVAPEEQAYPDMCLVLLRRSDRAAMFTKILKALAEE